VLEYEIKPDKYYSMFKFLTRYSTYTLLVALLISAISAYYSIVGLTAIFAAAVVPIIIMGAALELGKLVAAVWLKLNWSRSPLTYKLYLVPAVAFLMALTSMGIFGFLSKAHSDQSLVSGDSMAKIAVYDEKIKVSKDNIDVNRKALKQMDEAVDQVMGRSNDEKGADKAVQIRRSQQKERARLLADIDAEQKKISQLMEDRAPLAAENRKIEAEVGPIKYIAALIYGDSADSGVLEKAVRFVIIMIVAVFDPLALVLILAAQQSMRWEKEDELAEEQKEMEDVKNFFDKARETAQQLDREAAEQAAESAEGTETDTNRETSDANKEDDKVEESILAKHPYLLWPFSHFKDTKPMVYKASDEVTWPKVEEQVDTVKAPPFVEDTTEVEVIKAPEFVEPTVDSIITADDTTHSTTDDIEIETANVTVEKKMYDPTSTEYVDYEGKLTSMDALRVMRPDLMLPLDGKVQNKFNYGSDFPRESLTGDLFMRVDARPHRLFKFNGLEWIHVDKHMNGSYLYSDDYLQLLVDKLANDEYLPEMLTDDEDDAIREYLENKA
jgi:hypothetical protein